MSKILSIAAGALLLAVSATAQTVSPVIVEYREKASGSFQIYNDSFVPLAVILEPRSFSVNLEGKPTFRPLDPEIRVELSESSFRVGPQQTFTVFYKARSTRLPAWFTIYATITGPQTPTGIKLVLELPHTVYLLTKQPLPREAVVLHRAESGAKQIEAEIENRGREFIRVQEVEVASASSKKEFAGFPLFPGQRRILKLDWEGAGEPQRITLRFEKFKLESPLRHAAQTP
ncbi:MAG: hypothetical protein M1453_09340 [Acidobacteria bacterium]|nr:hypothetical protein [Acidobacteriota bacterium]MCL5288180.1 hypothetical protein [Acidobacteriota bacterium]